MPKRKLPIKKVRNVNRYSNFPIPSTRSANVQIPEVEASPLHDYKSYPMPDYLWSKLIRVYQLSRRHTSVKTKCFEISPSTAEEISLFTTWLTQINNAFGFWSKYFLRASLSNPVGNRLISSAVDGIISKHFVLTEV